MPSFQEDQYSKWSLEDLVRASTVDADDYIPEAISAIRKELDRRGVPRRELTETEAAVRSERIEHQRRIGGWLIVFLVFLGVWAIGFLLSPVTGNIPPVLDSSPLVWAFYLAQFAMGLLCCAVFWTIIRRKTSAPQYAIRLLWLFAAYSVLMIFTNLYVGAGSISVLPLLIIGAWISYFHRSRRVASTFGTDVPSEEH